MARRAHVYPQVDPGAAGLVDTRVVAIERSATVGAALALARRRDAAVVTVGDGIALRADLARADDLGLASLRAAELTRPVLTVGAGTPEVHVRRALAAGARAVLITAGRVVVGAATRPPTAPQAPAASSVTSCARPPSSRTTSTSWSRATRTASRAGSRKQPEAP